MKNINYIPHINVSMCALSLFWMECVPSKVHNKAYCRSFQHNFSFYLLHNMTKDILPALRHDERYSALLYNIYGLYSQNMHSTPLFSSELVVFTFLTLFVCDIMVYFC